MPGFRPEARSGRAGALEGAARLRALELQVTRRLDGLVQGDYLGLRHGPGSDLADARAYEPGDDARRIDWSLTARSLVPQVRATEADRELETWLVADRSPSMDFGTGLCEKRDLVLAGAAVFGVRSVRNGNRVGLVMAGGDRLEAAVPRSGRPEMLAMLAQLDRSPRRDGVPGIDLHTALRWVDGVARRRGRIVVLSDFLDGSDWAGGLGRLATRHDVVAVQTLDARELQLPSVGMLSVVDPESGRVLHVHTGSGRLRRRYAEAAAARHAGIARAVSSAHARLLVLRTDRDWVIDVAHFLARERRTAALRQGPASTWAVARRAAGVAAS